MSVTANDVFKLAMAIVDEIPDSGLLTGSDLTSYKVRTPSILTVLEAELLRASVIPISALDDTLHVDDVTARALVPYGLAAELFKMEDETIFNYCSGRYQALKRAGVKAAEIEAIEDYYGW